MGGVAVEPGAAPLLNRLAREQTKRRLLADLAVDATVCGLEGCNFGEYLDEIIGECERIALGMRRGSELPKWTHVCGNCGARISVFWTECKECGAAFDMSQPFERKLWEV
jgi:hypothetical protein